jgi:hypothetical protein
VKSTIPPPDQEILELLKKLETVKADYPPELLAARRAAFIAQVEQRKTGASKEKYPARDRMFGMLESLKSGVSEYPADLLAARRAAFISQIDEFNSMDIVEDLSSREHVIELLGNLKQSTDEYPPEILAARRAAFVARIKQHNRQVEQEEAVPLQNGRISRLLERLRAIEIEYPLKLWTARRAAFVGQIRNGRLSILDALRISISSLWDGHGKTSSFRRMSIAVATLLVTALLGSLLYGNTGPLGEASGSSLFQREVSHPGSVAASTKTAETARVFCKPGYLPPLCLAKEFDKSSDLTFPGNGAARPAVAKDTVPGYGRVHQPAYVNDGLYGPGASWVSNSSYSWIKIDLGKAQSINTVTFGRDRLGRLNDGDPGQFVIAVALSDNVYADGNSSNDYMEYAEVYDSEEIGFDGLVSGPETIKASFEPVTARYVKITFENAKTAVDEVEVFMIQPPGFASRPTRRPNDDQPRATFTPVPTNTLIPSATSTRLPTNTPLPTATNTLRPTYTNTPRPTYTPTDPPTNTPIPPTNTPIPPTDTPVPVPTDTAVPPTNTSIPPPNTPQPAPTDTPDTTNLSTEAPNDISAP